MRVLVCVLLLLCVSVVSVSCAPYKQIADSRLSDSVVAAYERAIKHAGEGAVDHEHILQWSPGTCVKLLQRACDARADCAGVSSEGALLAQAALHYTQYHQGHNIYIKTQTGVAGNIWPVPSNAQWGTNAVTVSSSLTLRSNSQSPDLWAAFHRYSDLMFQHQSTAKPVVPTVGILSISIKNDSTPLQLAMDESYSLTIPDNGDAAQIKANTLWGALRALETFSQLVYFNYSTKSYVIGNAPWNIQDTPRFQHRGLLIDTARHFQPVPVIKRVIDSLTYAKMNVLHWHVVDSQAFPFESRSYPLLWNGAYSAQERYTSEDMAEVVEYARQRGVRVLIEFDVPGHAQSWCIGYPEVCPDPLCPTPLDPSTQATFDLMTGLFKDATGGAARSGTFFDDYIHLGGDEVDTSCWSQTPRIAKWMADNNMTADDAYMYIVEKAHDIVTAQGRHPINWEEVFLHFGSKLDKRTIIHIWLDHATLAKVVSAGYQAILSNSDVWYLDHLATTWQKFYLNEPFQGITDPNQQKLVLGGEVCMWGETVDSSDIFNTIWPRAAAAAERLWSPADVTDTDSAQVRLERFRCLLNTRGVGAAPVNVNGRDAPPNPNSCYVQ